MGNNKIVSNDSKVFPNPSKDKITIEIQGNSPKEKVIEIFDSIGRIVMKRKMVENSIQRDSESLSKGLNFYKIMGSGRLIGKGKIIVE
ncbi:MAG: T9SS type A sorting domain-containing protein [Lutibacter sp.]|nr:T9SS type A sorting domain-containing protein [Lutibacter sp.]